MFLRVKIIHNYTNNLNFRDFKGEVTGKSVKSA